MSQENYTLLAYLIGMGLIFSYAVVLSLELRTAARKQRMQRRNPPARR